MDISHTTMRNVLRWAAGLPVYNLTCLIILGVENVWADLPGRWSARPLRIRRLVQIPEIISAFSDDFEWTTAEELARMQNTRNTRPSTPKRDTADFLFRTRSGAILVLDEAARLQLRLCVIVYTRPAGHRWMSTTLKRLQQSFWSTNMGKDIRKFVRQCLLCLSP